MQYPSEEYHWKAIYNNSEIFSQYSDNKENRYEEINRSRLKSFQVFRGEILVYWLELSPNQTLVFRKRNQLDNQGNKIIIPIIGWIGEKVQSFCWIMPNGMILQRSHFDSKEAIFSAPELLDCEK